MSETKWNHIFDNSNNKKNKSRNESIQDSNPYIDSIFKEMFQNINMKEGLENPTFEIFDKFNMHTDRPKLNFDKGMSKDFVDALYALRDFILCPFYKSDELIDSGIQTLLSVFLAVDCNNLNTNLFDGSGQTAVVDMTDLIDPELLYDDRTDNKNGFKNMREGLQNEFENNQRPINECDEKQKQASEDIKKYSKIIKSQIYRILFLPVVIHIFYNIFYMFCFKDMFGNKIPFIDIEEEYYNPYLKKHFDYFLGIVIKPVTILRNIMNSISKNVYIRGFSDNYPYVMYILLFFIILSVVEGFDNDVKETSKNIISMIGDLLTGSGSASSFFSWFSMVIMGIYFLMQFVDDTYNDWSSILSAQPISGTIKWLIYWILKFVINIFIFPVAGFLCSVYFVVYMFFGIFISQEKDVFDVYQDILDMVFYKIYNIYEPLCGENGKFWLFVQIISKILVLFLFEITIFFILFSGFFKYDNINNINVKSFLLILNSTGIFIMIIWCIIKSMTTFKELESKYGIYNTNEREKRDNAKKQRVKYERPNIVAQQKTVDKLNSISPVSKSEQNRIMEENERERSQKVKEYYDSMPS